MLFLLILPMLLCNWVRMCVRDSNRGTRSSEVQGCCHCSCNRRCRVFRLGLPLVLHQSPSLHRRPVRSAGRLNGRTWQPTSSGFADAFPPSAGIVAAPSRTAATIAGPAVLWQSVSRFGAVTESTSRWVCVYVHPFCLMAQLLLAQQRQLPSTLSRVVPKPSTAATAAELNGFS